MEMDFRCVFCSEVEVSIYKTKEDIQYHCYACNRKYNQDILNKYKNMSACQKLMFRLTHNLKE